MLWLYVAIGVCYVILQIGAGVAVLRVGVVVLGVGVAVLRVGVVLGVGVAVLGWCLGGVAIGLMCSLGVAMPAQKVTAQRITLHPTSRSVGQLLATVL